MISAGRARSEETVAMASETMQGVRTLFQGVTAGLSDDDLLRRFTNKDDSSEAAFQVLVSRHGPVVWRVCRRILEDPADAQDAFQATFLVLVQKAGNVIARDSLGPWLYGVGVRVARRAKINAARRRGRERTNTTIPDQIMVEYAPIDDLRAVLDHELTGLPARYRSALMLCYLEGLTHEEAAARLSCPVGTVRSRLARGRGLLQTRLRRRGFAPTLVGAALGLEAGAARAGIPEALVASTVKLVMTGTSAKSVPLALVSQVWRSALLGKLGRAALLLTVLLGSVVIVAVALARRRESDDSPLPAITVEQLAEQIEAMADAFREGLIETEYDEESIDFRSLFALRVVVPPPPDSPQPTAKRKPQESIKPNYEKVPGRSRHASDGILWKAGLDTLVTGFGAVPGIPQPRYGWVAGYDGARRYRGDRNLMTVTIGDTETHAAEWAPSFLFWHRIDQAPVLEDVLVPGAEISQKTVEGFRCYVVSSPRDSVGNVREAVISPKQSYLPLALSRTRNGGAELSATLADLRKLPDGRWYPRRVIVEERFQAEGSDRLLLKRRRDTRIVKFEPDHVFKPADFALDIPPNARVLDWRTGLFYRNDPWWPELGEFLRTEFDWPRADLKHLDALKSPDADLDGREAPPLLADRWLRGTPVSWNSLRGKVVLLVFPRPGDVAIIPALRRLRQAYGESGLEVVEVVPRTVDAQWAARYFAEYNVDHTVLYDAQLDGQYGATCAGYGVAPRPIDPNALQAIDAYLIDPNGRVHAIVEKGWSKAIVEKLRLAGSKAARPLALPDDLGPGLRLFRLHAAWEERLKTAPSTATLLGRVIDDQGRPIAAAHLRCQLFATVLGSWNSNLKIPSSRVVDTTTGVDGRFVMSSLCKGNYEIEIIAPGRAVSRREVIIGPALRDSDLTLVLAQADTITGIVRDGAGRAVPGARAELFNWHVDSGFDMTTYTLEPKKSVVTDMSGHFRFEGLREGRYSLTISARGMAGQTREQVSTGASNLEFFLKY
jgi:RNA polymerase sigma factor (sigma-70 family)